MSLLSSFSNAFPRIAPEQEMIGVFLSTKYKDFFGAISFAG